MSNVLRILLGSERYCRMFHVPTYGGGIEWYGRWCRPCGIFHGGDRRQATREKAA